MSGATGRRTSAGFVSIATVIAIVGSMLVVLLGASEKAGVLDLLNGHTWLRNTQSGTLSYVDDQAAKVDFNLKIDSAAGSNVRITQDGQVAVLVDPKHHTYASVDLGEYQLKGTQKFDEASSIDLVPDGRFLYVIDQSKGRVERRDGAVTTKLLGKVRLDGALTRGVVDDQHHLWVGDKDAGVVDEVGFENGDLVVLAKVKVAGHNADIEMSLVAGNPTALVRDNNELVTIENGEISSRLKIQLDPGETPTFPREVDDGLLPVAVNNAGKVLLISDGEPPLTVDLGRKGTVLGEPQSFGGKVYVPDGKAGEVIVIDAKGNIDKTTIKVPNASGAIDVVASKDAIYFQAPDGTRAIQVDKGGNSTTIDKVGPNIPTNDAAQPPEPPPTPPAPAADGPVVTIPASPPGAPAAPNAQAGNKRVDLSWGAAPENGAPVTGYVVTWTANKGAGGTQPVGSQTSTTIQGLTNGTTYTMSVLATSSAGNGPAAQANPVTPSSDIPDAPTGVTAKAGTDGSITVTWTAADDGHGNPVPSYDVTSSGGSGGGTQTVSATSATFVAGTAQGNVTKGQTYTFTVKSKLTTGVASPASSPTNPMKSHSAPDPPSGLGAVASASGTIHLQWDPCTPGAPCAGGENYSYQLQVGGAIYPSPAAGATQADIPGLTPGNPYVFTLTATNLVNRAATDFPSTVAASPPAITGSVSLDPDGRTVRWNVSVSMNGEAKSCGIVVVGGNYGCSSGAVTLAYSTPYSVVVTAVNNLTTATMNLGGGTTIPMPTWNWTVSDTYLLGTWARSGTPGGAWGSKSSPPAGATEWLPNGSSVALQCVTPGGSYIVQFANGTTQTWSWWGRRPDGSYVRLAVFVNSDGANGKPTC